MPSFCSASSARTALPVAEWCFLQYHPRTRAMPPSLFVTCMPVQKLDQRGSRSIREVRPLYAVESPVEGLNSRPASTTVTSNAVAELAARHAPPRRSPRRWRASCRAPLIHGQSPADGLPSGERARGRQRAPPYRPATTPRSSASISRRPAHCSDRAKKPDLTRPPRADPPLISMPDLGLTQTSASEGLLRVPHPSSRESGAPGLPPGRV